MATSLPYTDEPSYVDSENRFHGYIEVNIYLTSISLI
jgi:hypothetical protein